MYDNSCLEVENMGTTVRDKTMPRNDGFQNFLDEDRIELIKQLIENNEDKSIHVLPKEVAREVLTEKRMEIITVLRESEISSKRGLARELDRDIKNVSNDLDVLWKYSVVDYEDGKGTSKVPVLAADEIIVEPL